MKLSFKSKIIITMACVGVLCTAVAVVIANHSLHELGEKELLEKSQAILSRTEAASKYVAQMQTLEGKIKETLVKYPDGKIPPEHHASVLKSVPIVAAMEIGQDGAAADHYEFRVFAQNARNKKNEATASELEILKKFQANPDMKQYVFKLDKENKLVVASPVVLKAAYGCMSCHGNPTESPWKNGKDILGYPMENMKDGDLKAGFAIISDLGQVDAAAEASIQQIVIGGTLGTLAACLIGFLLLNGTLNKLAALAGRVHNTSEEVNQTSENLASASQQLASSSQEQASSVEEVSTSLEEIAGMVRSTVKGSEDSVELSNRIATLVETGNQSVRELQEAVNRIAESNQQVEQLSKLIQEIGDNTELIDEIVFQTRLLSFNASVEAERAGEHGRGFAVVAQEVGNLAQMSGKSAAEISQIVKHSIQQAQQVAQVNKSNVVEGVQLAQKAAQQLQSIAKASSEILNGSQSMLNASKEQSVGVQQINDSIQLINTATQQNASAAEQVSGGSLSLKDQGELLTKVVQDLNELVYGKAEKSESSDSKSDPKREAKKPTKEKPVGKSNVVPFKQKAPNVRPELSQLKATGTDDPWEKI